MDGERLGMHDFIIPEDSELWDIILDRLHMAMKDVKVGKITKVVPKKRNEYNEADTKKIEKSYKEKKLLVCGIRPNEYNLILSCETAKEIKEIIRMADERTSQVKIVQSGCALAT